MFWITKLHFIFFLCLLTAPVVALAQDRILISRGTEILVISSPALIVDSGVLRSSTPFYLSPGRLAIEINRSKLKSPYPEYRLLLTDTGLWAMARTNGAHFIGRKIIDQLLGWSGDAATEYPRLNCPQPTESGSIILLFPVKKPVPPLNAEARWIQARF